MPGSALRINLPTVVHETIDDETIIIHLGSGTYYSLDGCGTEVWGLLEEGAGRDQVVSLMQRRHDTEPALVQQGVLALLDQLMTEGVLVGADADGAPDAPTAHNGAECGGSFEAPVLHKYTDMQEFMLVDPLHEVDERAGWPHAQAG